MKFHEWFEKYQKSQNDSGKYIDWEETDRLEAAWQAARSTNSLCPGHGRAECVSCCWPAAEQPAGYTAVDMSTAAADGYRDGKANFEVTLPVLNPEMFNADVIFGHEKARAEAVSAIIAAGGKVK